MDLATFHQKYEKARSHEKIKIACDGGCGNEFEVLKTRAQQTIGQRGRYLCRSCGQAAKHAAKPTSQKTKERIAKGVHEARFKKLIADLEATVGMKRVLDWDLVMDANWTGGVLWTVERMKAGDITIIANYFDWYPKHKTWCFKEIYEEMGPVAISCPLRMLRQAPAYDETWRVRVRAYHKATAGKKPKLPQIIEKWLERWLESK